MNNNYYYLIPSTTYSGLSSMAELIVAAVRSTYANNVMSELAINRMVDTLRASAEELKREHPRWKEVQIELVTNDYTDGLYVSIDGKWSLTGYKVKDIVGYVG